MSKETVSNLLARFFKEDKTRRKLVKYHTETFRFSEPFGDSSSVAVSGDAAVLMAEMLRIFVRGKKQVWLQLYR